MSIVLLAPGQGVGDVSSISNWWRAFMGDSLWFQDFGGHPPSVRG